MFSYIKRHWPVYVILTLIAIALGFGAAYIVGAKGSTPASAFSEEVEQERQTLPRWSMWTKRWSKNRVRVPMGFLSPSRQSLMVDLRLQSRCGDLND